jgi:filamentous hemagglutinin
LNANGKIASGDALRVNTDNLTNDAGSIAAKRNATFNVANRLSNVGGSIKSDTLIDGTAGTLVNDRGTIAAPNGANISTAASTSAGGNQGGSTNPIPPSAGQAFDPGPGYVRVAPQDYNPGRYPQSGFVGPDGAFYYYAGTSMSVAGVTR